MLDLVRDLFVFCCYTGMAPVDLQRLKPYQINPGSDGLTWLTYTRAKSVIPANVPLLSSGHRHYRKASMEDRRYRTRHSFSFCHEQRFKF